MEIYAHFSGRWQQAASKNTYVFIRIYYFVVAIGYVLRNVCAKNANHLMGC